MCIIFGYIQLYSSILCVCLDLYVSAADLANKLHIMS